MSPQTWQTMAVPCAFMQDWSVALCTVYLNISSAYTLYKKAYVYIRKYCMAVENLSLL